MRALSQSPRAGPALGTQIEECKVAVLTYLWEQLEEERIKKVSTKTVKDEEEVPPHPHLRLAMSCVYAPGLRLRLSCISRQGL